MNKLKQLNDSLTSALIIFAGAMIMAVFALLGSISLLITLGVLVVLTALSVAFCLGSYMEQREHKRPTPPES